MSLGSPTKPPEEQAARRQLTRPKESPSEAEIRKVEGWFRDATSNQPHQRRKPKIPPRSDLVRIAALVGELKKRKGRTPSFGDKIVASIRKPRQALIPPFRRLKEKLVAVTRSGAPEFLTELLDVMEAVEPKIVGWEAKRGRPSKIKAQQRAVRVLREPVTQAVRNVGLRPSIDVDSPFVKVIRAAVAEIHGEGYSPDAISSCLRERHRSKPRAKSVSFLA